MKKDDYFEPHAYFARHRNAFRTSAVMQRLRKNLSDEQRALAELDHLVYMKLFDEMQTAKCILCAYPHHCDVLSLLNALGAEEGAMGM